MSASTVSFEIIASLEVGASVCVTTAAEPDRVNITEAIDRRVAVTEASNRLRRGRLLDASASAQGLSVASILAMASI